MKLYELTGEYIQLMQMLEDASAEDEAEIVAAMEAVTGDIEDKADAYARIMKNLQGDIDAIEQEEKRLYDRRTALKNRVDRLKTAIQNAMELTGTKKLKTSIGNWSIQKNPLSVSAVDVEKVPARFLIEQPPKVDRRAILEEFKQTGELLDGVTITQGESVRFR